MTLETALVYNSATTSLAQHIEHSRDDDERMQLIANCILQEFDDYYTEFRGISFAAEEAFSLRDFQTSVALSKRRLSVYSKSIHQFGPALKEICPELAEREQLWQSLEAEFLQLIAGRYEADLAFAYIHSVRRRVYFDEWRPVAYSFGPSDAIRDHGQFSVCWTFAIRDKITVKTVTAILDIPELTQPFRNVNADAQKVAEWIKAQCEPGIKCIDMIAAGFYRNRGAYLVGRLVYESKQDTIDKRYKPLIIALLNSTEGVYIDAILTTVSDAHNLFSSTLANFHVPHMRYHELVNFLHSIMPTRPLGLHYSTIGYNHVGKVAVMNELQEEIRANNRRYEHSPGHPGSVAIGFTSKNSDYNLKVIRDQPTDQYKWGEFAGIESVLDKYRRVHEINRTGSMLDNIIYYNIKLERESFAHELLQELLTEASASVSLRGDDVIFKHLIVQRRLTPLPVFLANATEQEAATAIVNLGYCIKNNAAADIFNKDLDARNYGVSRFLKVYLFDYDALEPFQEVKIRTNEEFIEGEDDVPDWYFEEGVVFLPEEIEAGLMLSDRKLRRVFRSIHGDLLTMEYWQQLQDKIIAGHVPSIRVYPEACQLAG